MNLKDQIEALLEDSSFDLIEIEELTEDLEASVTADALRNEIDALTMKLDSLLAESEAA